MSLSTHDIDALRTARHLTIRSTAATASITTRKGFMATAFHLASQPVPFVSTDPTNHELNVQPIAPVLGASPARGGEAHELFLRRVHLAPDWAAFTEGLEEGDDIRIQWECDGYALLLVHLRHGRPVGQMRWERDGCALLVADLRNGRSVGHAQMAEPGRPRRRWHRAASTSAPSST